MKWPVEVALKGSAPTYRRVWMILPASIVLIMINCVFLSRSLTTLNEGSAWVAHSEHVRFQLARVLQTLSDLGGGVNVYQLTHDERAFESALAAAGAIGIELSSLQELLALEPEQRPLVARLLEIARQRQLQSEVQRQRALRGDTAAVDREISSGDGRRLMDSARAVVGDMQRAETSLLEYHSDETRQARATATFAIWTTAILAILLLIAVALVTVREGRASRRALIDSSNALRETDRRKDVFLATLSHELRNPLAPIRTATRLLESANLSPAQVERCRLIISRQVRHMASLLDDLLDISRVTRGVLALKNENVELKSVLEAAVETAQPLIALKRHSLLLEWPAERITLRADPVRLTQVVANLLTNAAKYTKPDGKITLGARCDADAVVIFVRDDGIGIAPEMLPQVFEMFSQIDSGHDQADGGLGIGLALVKGFVALHGGRVEARSAGLGYGSEFAVYLPASLIVSSPWAQPEQGAPPESAAGPSRSVLIADDNRDGAEIMALLLNHSGYRVHVAHTGVEALAVAAEQHPDVALLDIGMPGMSGYEVARRIRSEAWGAGVHLIAVTGWGQDEDKRKAHEAGFDHHMTKPIDPAGLERVLSAGQRDRRSA